MKKIISQQMAENSSIKDITVYLEGSGDPSKEHQIVAVEICDNGHIKTIGNERIVKEYKRAQRELYEGKEIPEEIRERYFSGEDHLKYRKEHSNEN